ncbi:aldose epimerase family protein [Caviibacter abscessus]|uniref:aldose epimerase family protein n=1 Tax=Caviibacter abscessus TaxID=1766719 RepID=UPI000832B563|nr:hypothetical protein [Caviibacter abscessus]
MKITSFNISDNIVRYNIKKDNGFEVSILNLGCIIEKIIYNSQNMVLSYSDYSCYINNPSYMGALVGRTAGRIKDASFNIGDTTYKLDKNDGNNNNHGGIDGLHNKIFKGTILKNGIKLEYFDENNSKYPGKVMFTVIYTVDEKSDKIKMEYFATTNETTYINLTSHSYFNLSGLKETALNHYIKINSDKYLELANDMISENIKSVDNTVFDFRAGKYLNEDINSNEKQFKISYYFDHCFSLNKKNNEYDILLKSNVNGITMKIKTNQRAVVMYVGNFLDEVEPVDNIEKNPKHLGVALETQDYTNGINLGKDFHNLTTKDKPYYSFTELIFEKGEEK